MHRYVVSALLGAGLAVAAVSAQAGESLSQGIAKRLDKAPAQFTMTEAKRERLMMIQENMARQRYYDRRYGYGRGYGYGGPPPWAPAHGYRRHYERW